MARFLKLLKLEFQPRLGLAVSPDERYVLLAKRDEWHRSGASGGLPVAAFYYFRPSYFLITEVQFKIAVIGSATLARVSVGMMKF